MASPMSLPAGNWGGHGQQPQQQQQQQQQQQPWLPQQNQPTPPQADGEEGGVQLRLMGLKVSYSVDRDAQANYLARCPHLLHVKTIPIDGANSIGIVNVKDCAHSVATYSPELLEQDSDYIVYAYDYSEPDTPLVGQGTLSRILEADPCESNVVIGRVTKNLLAQFSGGVKETLEVKFKLVATARTQRRSIQQHQPTPDSNYNDPSNVSGVDTSASQSARPTEGAMTPTGAAEWNAFIQNNPHLGQPPASHSRVSTPALSQQNRAEFPSPAHHRRGDSLSHTGHSTQTQQHSFDHAGPIAQMPPHPDQQINEGPNRVAPTLVDASASVDASGNPPSRPSSRASTGSRKKAPTGRPRGRPKNPNKHRKAPKNQGSTSGYEDGTDGEGEPAKKKRATTTQVTRNINAPFSGGAPESLRVAASTAGSIRTLRPAGSGPEMAQGSHLQEIPRAPTPVPQGGDGKGPAGRAAGGSKLRRQSTLSQAATPSEQAPYCELGFSVSPPSQDGRSPDSEAATPMYSDESPAPIGSSPPVPRANPYMRPSPPASSPMLPPMPKPQPDSGFMSGGVDDSFEGPIRPLDLAPSEPTIARPKPKRSLDRDLSNVPIQVFDMQLQALDSETDMHPSNKNSCSGPQPTSMPPVPSSAPGLPPLKRTRSDPKSTMPPPPPQQQAEKGPSPQQDDQKAAVKRESATPDRLVASEAARIPTLSRSQSQPTGRPSQDQDVDMVQHLRVAVHDDPPTVFDKGTQQSNTGFVPPPLPLPRPTSLPDQRPPVPASDPAGPALPVLSAPEATSFSEAPCPPSDAIQAPISLQIGDHEGEGNEGNNTEGDGNTKNSKNYVKKASIRQRLEKAIESGEMPPYCHNCGAIETTTWRKIWTQDRTGMPDFYEFSEKPGKVTALIVLERDETDEDKITKYQLVKKSLAPKDYKPDWTRLMLCNPCGIWLSKWKSHRPEQWWDKNSVERVSTRSRRGGGGKARTKKNAPSSAQETTSAMNLQTDPAGPVSESRDTSPNFSAMPASDGHVMHQQGGSVSQSGETGQSGSREASLALEQVLQNDGQQKQYQSQPGSTHSRGSGTAKSPIALDEDKGNRVGGFDMGSTRRLLFSSPRKEGVPKVLGEVAINVVQTSPRPRGPKELEAEKENMSASANGGEDNHMTIDDDLEALFQSPAVGASAPAAAVARPSTPPPKDPSAASTQSQGPFKTPTRPTPSHRPITRSISRSARSARSSARQQQEREGAQQTPSRTPRSSTRRQQLVVPESPSLRRSPRFAGGVDEYHHDILETPMTRSINQLLSEAHDFDMDPADMDLDLSGLEDLHHDHDQNQGQGNGMIDFGCLLGRDSADAQAEASRRGDSETGVGFDYVSTASMWAEWSEGGME